MTQAPQIFQRFMDEAFKNFMNFCIVYIDDILVFSNTEEEHYLHVAAILQRCKNLGIVLSKKKTQFFQEDINFLGLEIKQGTLFLQPHILEKIITFFQML